MRFEAEFILFLQGAGEGWITFFKLITLLASWLGLFVVFVAIFVKNKKLSLAYVATFVTALILNIVLKQLIARPRPFDSYDAIINFGNEKGFSMPSSHALCAGVISVFVCYLVFNLYKSKLTRTLSILCMLLYFAMIALSRMILGVHYLTDVIAGGVLGALLAAIGIILYNVINKRLEKRNGKN